MEKSEITLISPTTKIIGNFEVKNELHFYGQLMGEIKGATGSVIHLKEGSLIEGKVNADTLVIEGFVKGDVHAHQKVWITGRGKLVGSIHTPSLQVDPGAVFEAKVGMT
ncbi:MAG: polymer-forming cytoskeletal protein [Bdellovibrionales bacterium]|nr:polymer-forming cytoskeletal protein [Bdellovibrionales bacterium]